MDAASANSSAPMELFIAARLERVFNDCFATGWNTRLCGGADEPLYEPAGDSIAYNALYYRSDYFASALHESAHWCIAGATRRRLRDFGYWYTPEDRNIDEQLAFERVEYKPQAIEWFFSRACGFRFQVSADNLELARHGKLDTAAFQHRVLEQVTAWSAAGLPRRAALFYDALCREFGTATPAERLQFTLAELE